MRKKWKQSINRLTSKNLNTVNNIKLCFQRNYDIQKLKCYVV